MSRAGARQSGVWAGLALTGLLLGALVGLAAPCLAVVKSLAQYASTLWRMEDGLPQNALKKILQTRDGYLWVATAGGLERVAPRAPARQTLPVMIEQVSVDNRPYSPATDGTAPPGKGELVFQFTALDHHSPQKLRFKYKLEGYDTDWVEAGGRHTAFYTNIPPGRYHFLVRVYNGDGVWNSTGAAYTFTLRTSFTQTTLFRLLGLALLLAAGGVYALRVQSLRRLNRALVRKVAERTNDLLQMNEEFQAMQAELEAQNQDLTDA